MAILFPALKRPDESTSPFHQYDRPAFTILRRDILVHFRIKLIAFDHLLKKGVCQGINEQNILAIGQATLPKKQRILRNREDPAGGVQADALGAGLEHLNDEADRFPEPVDKGVFGLREEPIAGLTSPQPTGTVTPGFVSSVAPTIRRTAMRALPLSVQGVTAHSKSVPDS